MKQKIIDWFKSITLTKRMESRIRRIVEMVTFVVGVVLIVVSTCKIVFFKGTFTGNLIELTVGMVAIQIAYRGLVEDLPRVGALSSNRRFWE